LDDLWDVEECEGGWLLACDGLEAIVFLDANGVDRAMLGCTGKGAGQFQTPSALALVPGLGLVVREVDGCRIQVFG
jgi:hypothetical protein